MMDNTRIITRARQVDFSTRAEGEDIYLEGYFVVFDSPYHVWDGFEEIVKPGAFEGCDMSDVRALIDHTPHLVLGRNTADTLSLSIDDKGLFGRIKINRADVDAMNLYARTQRGDVNQASFGFDEMTVAYTDLPDGRTVREIQKIAKLWEISVCTFPAYEETYVEARRRDAQTLKTAAARRKKNELIRRLRKC